MTTQQILGMIRHFEDSICRLRVGNAADWLTAFGVILFCASGTTAPAQTLHTLVGFNGINGSSPQASLVQGVDGNFYGVTVYGGANNQGTLFKMTPQGEFTTLYSFCSLGSYCPDGSFPLGGLVQGTDGNFYGTATNGGGAFNTWGTIFKISSEGLLTTLHSFQFVDGAVPRGTLVQGSDGNFYGTTWQGGVNSACFDGNERGCGTVFKITPDGNFTTLYSFCAQSLCSDGANPVAGLVQGSDGNFYGTTYDGGPSTTCAGGCGTVFKITPAGGLTTLHNFCIQAGCPDGMYINAGLVQGSDGNFYGTAFEGGTVEVGTVFKISPNGQFATLYSFCPQVGCAEGGYPLSALVQGYDGRLYGTTSAGGAKAAGAIFAIRSNGQLTTLYTFCSHGVYPYCLDGNAPVAALVQGSDGKFYGTTMGNTVKQCIHNDCGTIFTLEIPTSTSLTSSLNPSVYGQNVTWTATVTSAGSLTPTGKVNFTWSGHSIGSATLNSGGMATLTRSNLNAYTYPLTAVYAGDANNSGSTSAVLNQVVLQNTSSAALTSSPNPSTQGQAMTFTATISSATVTPTGPVTFTAGTTVLGTAQLSGGKAKLTVSSLALGSTKVTATYYGNSNIAKSSASVVQTVQ
jgi:uncharacterized repeat protein (TIGR03803 family)